MGFKKKFEIETDYLDEGSTKRPGNRIYVQFIVAHDIEHPNLTARESVDYYQRTQNQSNTAVHFLVDDKQIIECIPAVTHEPEYAFHVIYDVNTSNALYDTCANNSAIGVELCYGEKIDKVDSYKRYVWLHAYICYKFGLNPRRDIIGHDVLDCKLRSDPTKGLEFVGKSFNQFIMDVVNEFESCTKETNMIAKQVSVKNGKLYTIRATDTLQSLTTQFGIKADCLKKLNPELDIHALYEGQSILIEPGSPQLGKNYINLELEEYMRSPPIRPYPGKPIKRGDRGRNIEAIQRTLRVSVDGIFGKETEEKVKEYQRNSSFLSIDGVVGMQTWYALF
ncbi:MULTISPECIES: N-acetylmuramoyl-L-alanine amidase [Bacillus cereus group]|uniref:N-acetylmuramoyl-L-alanine amidase n=1 Tax=Bacillus cereus group TaxID=86661 RepID=UPI000BEBD26B|nr:MULTISPECIES: N-acetylmuramoyl-L-alanine amidase [Bacillus cereus group]PEF53280.1 N-acetylmuramoyl-L-alanine amidase [Bacillus thuringiensis]PFP00639.1 N-acetylmuramoyl-L-alanine amidase [Bacillus cereus]WIK99200.1 N-acetylmuramoyl-L-alanine amidase [Bacillus bombysepticus]